MHPSLPHLTVSPVPITLTPGPNMRRLSRLLVVPLLAVATSASAAAQKGLKVYISADMEGIAGVVTADQLGPSGFEYNRFREFMTSSVLAAIEGAREAGATEFVVSDSHGNGESLLIDRFPEDVTIVRSWPRPLGMMQGIDSTFDAVLFIGYHAATTNPAGVRAHTLSSAHYAAVKLNGVAVPEAGISAAIAGHFGVPVVMISGDNVAVSEAQQLIDRNIAGAVVKQAIGFHSAATLTPQAADKIIRAQAKAGVERRAQIEPWVLKKPVRLDLTFKNYLPAEVMALLPIIHRTDSHTIHFEGKDMPEVSRMLEFIGEYSPDLTP
ncbi:MAG TPA: M55 family metallopeptidase [Gemmatimonadaceae bacterium]|nr:M55 family metallopeptidase [Gemmatimonadaceae bacterium]